MYSSTRRSTECFFITVVDVEVDVQDPVELLPEGEYCQNDVVDVAESGRMISLRVVPAPAPIDGHPTPSGRQCLGSCQRTTGDPRDQGQHVVQQLTVVAQSKGLIHFIFVVTIVVFWRKMWMPWLISLHNVCGTKLLKRSPGRKLNPSNFLYVLKNV